MYTIDPGAEEPIMLLDSHIGYDEEDGQGIRADQFSRELLFLDSLNKSKINVWINSTGGNVVDGMQIFNTILKTKTKVDTHNVGMAASSAAWIFLAGRNRYMMDNAVFMVHQLSGPEGELKNLLEGAINTMISSRSYLTPERVKGMMDATTWLSAQDCYNLGICEVESSGGLNKKRATPDLSDIKNAHKYYNSAIQNFKIKPMKQVTNKLKLNESANEEAIVGEIEKIENRAKEAEGKSENLRKEITELTNKFDTLKAEHDKIVLENKAAKEAKEKAEKEALTNKVNALVDEAVKVGKIVNDAKVIDNWKNKATADFDSTKELIDAIPLNKKGASITTTNVVKEENLTMVAANTMHELRNKYKIN